MKPVLSRRVSVTSPRNLNLMNYYQPRLSISMQPTQNYKDISDVGIMMDSLLRISNRRPTNLLPLLSALNFIFHNSLPKQFFEFNFQNINVKCEVFGDLKLLNEMMSLARLQLKTVDSMVSLFNDYPLILLVLNCYARMIGKMWIQNELKKVNKVKTDTKYVQLGNELSLLDDLAVEPRGYGLHAILMGLDLTMRIQYRHHSNKVKNITEIYGAKFNAGGDPTLEVVITSNQIIVAIYKQNGLLNKIIGPLGKNSALGLSTSLTVKVSKDKYLRVKQSESQLRSNISMEQNHDYSIDLEKGEISSGYVMKKPFPDIQINIVEAKNTERQGEHQKIVRKRELSEVGDTCKATLDLSSSSIPKNSGLANSSKRIPSGKVITGVKSPNTPVLERKKTVQEPKSKGF